MTVISGPAADPATAPVAGPGSLPAQKPPRSGIWPPVLAGAGVAGAVAVLRFRDPHVAGSYGVCPLLAVTGFDCPLCGGLRATNLLAHGNVAGAFDSNAFFVASVPLLVGLWVWWLMAGAGWARGPRWGSTRSNAVVFGGLALLLAFGVVRNLPGLEYLKSGF